MILLGIKPSEINTMNSAKFSRKNTNIPREDSVIFLLNSYLDLNFDVLHAASGNKHADIQDIRLVLLRSIALFSNYKLTTSGGNHLEDISHAHIVSVMYKLINSARDTDDLCIGFDRDRGRRQRELTNNKNKNGKIHLRFMLKNVFGFAENQEKKLPTDWGINYP